MSSDYTNNSTGVVCENELLGTIEPSVSVKTIGKHNEQKENQSDLVNGHKTIKKVTITINTIASPKKMENQLCTTDAVVESFPKERICLVGTVATDENVKTSANSFKVPVLTSKTGVELCNDTEWITYFVLSDFGGENFATIRESEQPIYGPVAIQQLAQSGNGLVYAKKPRYNFAMKGVVTCFSGFHSFKDKQKAKNELRRLFDMIHAMGGSIRKDMHESITHLISPTSSGKKYHYAKIFGVTVVQAAWIEAAWEHRDEVDFSANDSKFIEAHKLKPFEGLRICFYGFSTEEHQEMVDVLKSNGGLPADLDDPECSHLILANNVTHIPEAITGPKSPVKLNSVKTLHEKPTPANLITETPEIAFKHNHGMVLPGNEENLLQEPVNLSPILHHIEEEEDGNSSKTKEMSKRKRDSFDNISIISTDTFAAQFNSAKKPKLIRSGSITRSLSRSMSFAGMKNPIRNMFRARRDSIDPNASISSVTSMESTFIDTLKRPVKEKLIKLKDRITNSNRSKREFCLTPKTPRKFNNSCVERGQNDDDKFVLPNEISMLSCRNLNLVNSTMNATMIAAIPEPEYQPVGSGMKANAPRQTNEHVKNIDVVDSAVPEPRSQQPVALSSDWFWYTIQKGIADTDDYLFSNYLANRGSIQTGDRCDSLTRVMQRKRKRISVLGANSKRRTSETAQLSMSSSFLDFTNSPKPDSKDSDCSMENTPKSKKQKSMRFNHFMDLYSTETNYVGIINMIMTEFQKPLEEMVGKKDEELLNKSELRAIFSNFAPLFEVHSQMLNHFREMQLNWKEDCLIGKVILDHRAALLKAYPPYVNYFEQMKSALLQCIAQNPKFHAFLKINQSKPQCGRQTLQELMIQPVQRLPFMGLLVKDILKHTPKSNPDHKELEKALNAINDVNNYINEDKRKTEGYTALLNIINDIDNCPASLLSSNRRYISECEVCELSKCLGGRDDRLMIILFTDYIEICKIREARGKPYKHIRLIPLNAIPCVYDIKDSERVFAIEVKDELFCFKISEKHEKMELLKNLCRQLAENAHKIEYEQFIRSRESHELGIDINLGTLKKVRDYAKTFFSNE